MQAHEHIQLSHTTMSDSDPGYDKEVGTGPLSIQELDARVPADMQVASTNGELVDRANTPDSDACADGIRGNGDQPGFPDSHKALRWASLHHKRRRVFAIAQSGLRTGLASADIESFRTRAPDTNGAPVCTAAATTGRPTC